MKQILEKNCVVCGKSFEKGINCSLKRWNENVKYCSWPCMWVTKKGNKNRLGISHPAWNKGIPTGRYELSLSWKGEKAGYSAKHKWIKSKRGNPDKCEHCLKSGFKRQQIHWANVDHKYKRVLEDWLRLCSKCHQTYDTLHKLR